MSLRVRDSRRSRNFYEHALGPLGYSLSKRFGNAFGFRQGGRHDFWVTRGTVGTPTHLAFHALDRGAVDAFYKEALEAGGRDNGRPGVRRDYGYAAFVLDPDGHNVEAVIWKEEERPRRLTRKVRAKAAAPPRPRRSARR